MSTDQRSHIVPNGKAIFAIRIIQAALAFVILGSMAFNVAVFGGWSAFGLGLFTVRSNITPTSIIRQGNR
jgi:hypothetical protein